MVIASSKPRRPDRTVCFHFVTGIGAPIDWISLADYESWLIRNAIAVIIPSQEDHSLSGEARVSVSRVLQD